MPGEELLQFYHTKLGVKEKKQLTFSEDSISIDSLYWKFLHVRDREGNKILLMEWIEISLSVHASLHTVYTIDNSLVWEPITTCFPNRKRIPDLDTGMIIKF